MVNASSPASEARLVWLDQTTESIMQDMRTTTGQRVSISYDPSTNALTFRELDWFADPVRATGIRAVSRIVRRSSSDNVTTLAGARKRRRIAQKAA